VFCDMPLEGFGSVAYVDVSGDLRPIVVNIS
jgi:hypothetical protein